MASKRSSVSATNLRPSAMTTTVRSSSKVVAGDLGVVLQRGVDDGAVDLAQHRLLDGRMLQHLAHDAAVAAADDQHALGLVHHHQRHVRHHLVVDELVRRRELAHAVEHQHRAPGLVLEDDEVLVLGLDLVQDLIRLEAHAPVWMKRLLDPAIHSCLLEQLRPARRPAAR